MLAFPKKRQSRAIMDDEPGRLQRGLSLLLGKEADAVDLKALHARHSELLAEKILVEKEYIAIGSGVEL